MNDSREEEMEEDLQAVSNAVNVLKNMSIDIGNEIDTQNKSLSHICGVSL